MKLKHILSVSAAAAVVALASQANAGVNLIVNGNFAAGDTDFSSDYTDVTGSGLATGPGSAPHWNSYNETTYAINTNSNLQHNLWDNLAAPGGSGNYLIANGNSDPKTDTTAAPGVPYGSGKAVDVWYQTVSLTGGKTYDFSAEAADIYSTSPATLEFIIGGTVVTSGTLVDATWNTYAGTYKPSSSGSVTVEIVDTNLTANGNDFGVDNISLTTTVPEPSTWAMMGLGFAGLAFAGYRSRRAAISIA